MSGRRLIDDTAPGYNACFQAMLRDFIPYSGASNDKQAWREGLSWLFNRSDHALQLRNGQHFGGFRRLRIRS